MCTRYISIITEWAIVLSSSIDKDIHHMGFNVTMDREKCSGCEECLEICSAGVFEMQNGRAVPVNAKECIGCETCIEVCEQHAISIEETGIQLSDQCLTLLRDIL